MITVLCILWPCSLAVPVLAGWVCVFFLWFYVQQHPKAQPAVVLVLKRLRRGGNGLKSHPTDWEKPGIEPATFYYLADSLYMERIRFQIIYLNRISNDTNSYAV